MHKMTSPRNDYESTKRVADSRREMGNASIENCYCKGQFSTSANSKRLARIKGPHVVRKSLCIKLSLQTSNTAEQYCNTNIIRNLHFLLKRRISETYFQARRGKLATTNIVYCKPVALFKIANYLHHFMRMHKRSYVGVYNNPSAVFPRDFNLATE